MISRRTSSIPKEDVFPRLLYSDSACSKVLPGAPEGHDISPVNSDPSPKRVILRQRVRGSVRAVRAVRNTRVFLTETRVVADAAALGPAPAVALFSPCGSSHPWGPRQWLRRRSSLSAFCSRFSPSALIWLCPLSPQRWVSPLSPSPSPHP